MKLAAKCWAAAADAPLPQASTLPPPVTLATTHSAGLDLLWEADLFGVTRNAAAAAGARAAAAGADWHDLRVTLAAETAGRLVDLRACEAMVEVAAEDARSQRRTADLTAIKAQAGLEAPANAALAGASAADAGMRLTGQQAQCDSLVKSLVALAALDEPDLRARLAARRAQIPQPAAFAVDALPARALMQRPDLRALEHQTLAAAADLGAARADRYPRLSLAGAISLTGLRAGGASVSGSHWSIGPTLSGALFDAGRRAANAEAAQARYREALARYEQRARDAVREVEQALVGLDAAGRREADALIAAQGFRLFFEAAQARYQGGVGSVLELESARRNALAASAALIDVQRARVAAWIALYRAVGGGWSAAEAVSDSATGSSGRDRIAAPGAATHAQPRSAAHNAQRTYERR